MSAFPAAELSTPDLLTVETIERVLADLWRDIGDARGESAMQVRMLNLLVFLPAPPPPPIRIAINAVAVQYPGRTVLVAPDDGPPRAEATIACRVAEGSQQACGEQIVLAGTVDGRPLYSLAISLLLPGLPVSMWWYGPIDFDGQIFARFAKVADQLVFDTRTWPEPLAGLMRLRREMAAHAPNVRFSDLLWLELMSWRRSIAAAFDLPAGPEMLTHLDRVALVCGSSDASLAAGLLLAGWLASRLDWELVEASIGVEPGEITLRRRGRRTGQAGEVHLTLRRDGVDEGVTAVEMRAADGSGCSFRSTANGVETRVERPGHAPLTRAAHLRGRSVAALLGEELAINAADRVYAGALALAARLAEHAGTKG